MTNKRKAIRTTRKRTNASARPRRKSHVAAVEKPAHQAIGSEEYYPGRLADAWLIAPGASLTPLADLWQEFIETRAREKAANER